MYEGGTKVVAFVAGPSTLLPKQGHSYDGLMHGVDWFPTLLKLAGNKNWNGTVGKPLDGIDQWEAISENLPSPRTEILYNYDVIQKTSALRMGDWKLMEVISCKVGTSQCCWPKPANSNLFQPETKRDDCHKIEHLALYNLKTDPYETNNVASSNPDIVKKLEARLKIYKESSVRPLNENLPNDPKSNPKFHDGYWGPWRK